MPKSAFALLLTGTMLMAQTIDRTKLPETPPIPKFKMPPIHETKLPNGLSVVLLEDPRFPLVSVRLSFQAGSKFDPKDMPGLAGMVAGLLTQGTKTRSYRDLAEELTSIGATLNGNTSPDVLTLGGSVLAENTTKLLDLTADVALNANFPENEVQLRKQNRKQGLLAQRSQPSFLAREKFDAVLFGDHPYAYIAPTMESIDRMDQKSMIQFRDAFLVPNNAVLLLVGQLPGRTETLKLVRERFGGWKEKPVPAAPAKNFPASKRQLVLVDRPGSVQADIHIGRLAATRTDPDYYPLLVGNAILGGGASSRLFIDVREKQGFAYDAHSDISGTFLLSLETQASLADQVDLVKTMGLPNDYLEMFTTRVRSVEPDQIQAAARKYLAPDNSAIVVVGDASKIEKPLEKFGSVQVEKAK